MKVQTLVLSAFLLLPTATGKARAAEADWVGLWVITQTTQTGPQEFHLFVPNSGDAPDFYGRDWVPLTVSEFRAEGDSLFLNWQTKGTNLVFEGTRVGDRISGKWRLLHPQYQEENAFSARLALKVSNWSPLPAELSGPVVDLNAKLAEHASDLDSYWTASFHPEYFVFLDTGASLSGARERLRDPGFAVASMRLASVLDEVVQVLPSKLNGFKLPATVVLLPFGEADRFRLEFVQDRSFLLVNPKNLVTEAEAGKEAVARRLLESLLDVQFGGRRVGDALMREGLTAYALRRLGYVDDDAQALRLSDEELAAQRGRLVEIREKIAGKRALTAAETAVAGLDFVDYLSAERPFPKLYGASAAETERELKRYLRQ